MSRPALLHSDIPSDLTEGIGVIGDSISDEYRFYAPDRATARNWVEILAASRGLYFGNPILASGSSTGDRRFAFNWSQSGATTTSLIARGRNAGLAAQVAGGAAISLAVITIEANDFADVLITSRSVAAMAEVLERASSNFAVILESLLCISSALKVAIFTAVDLRVSPTVRGALNSGLISAQVAEAYGTPIQVFNDRLKRSLSFPRGTCSITSLARSIPCNQGLPGSRSISKNGVPTLTYRLFPFVLSMAIANCARGAERRSWWVNRSRWVDTPIFLRRKGYSP
jgi:hypothetical protein